MELEEPLASVQPHLCHKLSTGWPREKPTRDVIWDDAADEAESRAPTRSAKRGNHAASCRSRSAGLELSSDPGGPSHEDQSVLCSGCEGSIILHAHCLRER